MKKILFLPLAVALFSCNNQEKSKTAITTNESQTAQSEIIVTEPSEKTEGKIQGVYGGCGYNYTPEQTTLTLYQPRPREISQINSILKFSGLSSNFRIYSAHIENAVATIINGKRYILYDPNLLSYTDAQSGNYWSSMSILAHEIGHHLSGHTITNKGSNPHDELEADKYSGFILYKLGASLNQATAAIISLGADMASATHPAKSERIKAISKGWTEANQTRYNGAIPPPPNDNASDFCEYKLNMLISKENLQHESADIWYGEYKFLTGIITEVDKDLNSIKIHVVKTGEKLKSEFRSIDGELWTIYLDQKNWSGENEMGHACSMNLPFLLIPGRRLKFAMVEGYPGCGTAMNGVWFLTYAKAMEGNSL
jgi:hypothetical protein